MPLKVRMSALDVFHDEIAHLVLTEQRTRQYVCDHLVRKYGKHKGLSLRNVKYFCQLNGFHREHPRRSTKNPLADNLRKVKNRVSGIPDHDDDTEIAHDEFEQIVTEFPNNSVQVDVQFPDSESFSNQQQGQGQGEDHEYHVSAGAGSTQQGNRLQKETKVFPVTIPVAAAGDSTSTTGMTTGDHGVTNRHEAGSAGDEGASSTADGNLDGASVSFKIKIKVNRIHNFVMPLINQWHYENYECD